MVSTATIALARTLLAGGASVRAVARELCVSRDTVRRIERGTCDGTYRRKRPEKKGSAGEVPIPSGPYVGCKSCGGRVMLPCLACWLRSHGYAR
jgi:hypothetical protein